MTETLWTTYVAALAAVSPNADTFYNPTASWAPVWLVSFWIGSHLVERLGLLWPALMQSTGFWLAVRACVSIIAIALPVNLAAFSTAAMCYYVTLNGAVLWVTFYGMLFIPWLRTMFKPVDPDQRSKYNQDNWRA